MPFVIAFYPSSGVSSEFQAVMYTIDCFFFLDILLNFRTTFINTKTGEEVFDMKEIAKHYILNGNFFLDFCATFPFTLVFDSEDNTSGISMLRMLKLVRILRVSKIIYYMREKQ